MTTVSVEMAVLRWVGLIGTTYDAFLLGIFITALLTVTKYKVDGNLELHNPAEGSTTKCPLLPGQRVNLLEVPHLQIESSSISSYHHETIFTMNPLDRFVTPRSTIIARPDTQAGTRPVDGRRSAKFGLVPQWPQECLGRLQTAAVDECLSTYADAMTPNKKPFTHQMRTLRPQTTPKGCHNDYFVSFIPAVQSSATSANQRCLERPRSRFGIDAQLSDIAFQRAAAKRTINYEVSHPAPAANTEMKYEPFETNPERPRTWSALKQAKSTLHMIIRRCASDSTIDHCRQSFPIHVGTDLEDRQRPCSVSQASSSCFATNMPPPATTRPHVLMNLLALKTAVESHQADALDESFRLISPIDSRLESQTETKGEPTNPVSQTLEHEFCSQISSEFAYPNSRELRQASSDRSTKGWLPRLRSLKVKTKSAHNAKERSSSEQSYTLWTPTTISPSELWSSSVFSDSGEQDTSPSTPGSCNMLLDEGIGHAQTHFNDEKKRKIEPDVSSLLLRVDEYLASQETIRPTLVPECHNTDEENNLDASYTWQSSSPSDSMHTVPRSLPCHPHSLQTMPARVSSDSDLLDYGPIGDLAYLGTAIL